MFLKINQINKFIECLSNVFHFVKFCLADRTVILS